MKPHEQDAGDELADIESELKSLRPRAPGDGFAARVAMESELRALRPRSPSAGFAERVAQASVSGGKSRLLRFPGALVPFAAAAAVALLFAPALLREPISAAVSPVGAPAPVAAPVSVVAESSSDLPEEALHLPVINLPDGSAYRPVLRPRLSSPGSFRAMPGGAVMPVSLPVSAGVDYEPVIFD